MNFWDFLFRLLSPLSYVQKVILVVITFFALGWFTAAFIDFLRTMDTFSLFEKVVHFERSMRNQYDKVLRDLGEERIRANRAINELADLRKAKACA